MGDWKPYGKMIGVSFYHRVVPPNRLHARIGRVFFSKFLYVRDFPEYPWGIARMVANPLSLLRSSKTYSRYLKKIRPSDFPPVFLVTQYLLNLVHVPGQTLQVVMSLVLNSVSSRYPGIYCRFYDFWVAIGYWPVSGLYPMGTPENRVHTKISRKKLPRFVHAAGWGGTTLW